MAASVGLFAAAFLISIAVFLHAVLTGGAVSFTEGIAAFFSMLMCAGGFFIALYGRFIVKAESRLDYRLGLALNGIWLLLLVFLYFLGI